MSNEIKVGDVLIGTHPNYNRKRMTEPDLPQGAQRFNVLGETRQSWLVGRGQREQMKVNKQTMIERNNRYTPTAFSTIDEFNRRRLRSIKIREIRHALGFRQRTERYSDEQIAAAFEALGLEIQEPDLIGWEAAWDPC